jgi:lysophospholipid acyltransferase (LPLAT)-like uncharacterized protein
VSNATWQQKLVGQVNAFVLPKALGMLNTRISYYDKTVDPCGPEYDEHVIYVFWHEHIGIVLPTWGHTAATILCSQHRDGEWVNQFAAAMGLHIVRGSSSRGGSAAIRQLKKNSKFSSIVITPDGPRGPRREMALGPIYMASLLKMPIVPLGIGISNAHRLNTWDKFAIPKPTSRVRIIAGPKIRIQPKADRHVLEASRANTQQLMNTLCDHAQDWADSGQKMLDEHLITRKRLPRKIVFPAKPKSIKPKLALHTVANNETPNLRKAAG